jgi:hypothetical protein
MISRSSAVPSSPTGTHTADAGARPRSDGGTSASGSRAGPVRATARPVATAPAAAPVSGQPSANAGSSSGIPHAPVSCSRPATTRTIAVTSAA